MQNLNKYFIPGFNCYNGGMSRTKAFKAGQAAREAGQRYAPTKVPGDKWSSIHIMMGDHPSGVTSATIEGIPGLSSTVRMYKGKKNVGVLNSGRDIEHIETHSEHMRQGIATEMDRLANFSAGLAGNKQIAHGTTRTSSGDAWADAVGGRKPEKTPSFGITKSLLKDME